MLGAVECGIYLYISMGTIMSIMLLFIRLSRIHRAAIVFKSLRFGPFTLKVIKITLRFQIKTGSAAFLKVFVFDLENAGVA